MRVDFVDATAFDVHGAGLSVRCRPKRRARGLPPFSRHPRQTTQGLFMFTPNLVVFSHLRWRFVHQRPQHLLGRLAGQWRITFIEEPVPTDGLPYVQAIEIGENLTVLIPHTPVAAQGFHDEQFEVL
ncbi:MAG: hypothetical protein B7X94_03900, partial [Hydrogenophilales bacterium 17-62-8]